MTADANRPDTRGLRRRLRRARRAHHGRSAGEVLNDLYVLLWAFGVYGGILVNATVRHLGTPAPAVPAATRWLVVAALLVLAGFAWRVLRVVGPVLVTPAERTWIVSAPVDRGRWLRPRAVLLLLGVGLGAALAAVVGGVAVRSEAIGWSALAGAALGLTLAGAAVGAQRGAEAGTGSAAPAVALGAAGMLLAGAVVVAGRMGVALPVPPPRGAVALLAVGVPLAVAATARALRALARLDAAALGGGADVATAGVTAAVGMDLSLLSSVLEVRRWRRVGSVRSRPFHGWRRAPWLVLLEAEVRRLLRRPEALAVWGALALAHYALSTAAPGAAPYLRPILAYVAASRLTAGLRTLSRARGLARGLAVGETRLRTLHMIVPALGTAAWWLATAPGGGLPVGRLDVALVIGVVASVYRAATRPPMSYEGVAVETPFGLFPLDMIRQILRGPDLLALTILARLVFRR